MGTMKNVTKGRKCHRNQQQEGIPVEVTKLTKLSLYTTYGN